MTPRSEVRHTLFLAVDLCAIIIAGPASAAEKSPFHLAAVRQAVRTYTDSLQVPGRPYGCYQDARTQSPSLYASCDAAIMRTVMGEDLQTALSDRQRAEWIGHINSFSHADGTYATYRGHSTLHANGMVVGALGVLGGRQQSEVSLYGAFDTVDKVGPWLELVDWRNQWSGSHWFWGGMHCFSLSRRCSDPWRDAVFDWLDANLDPQTGWWRKGVAQARPGIDGLGGGAHIWPIYQHHGRKFPYPERVIDSILAMQHDDGRWLRHGNYLDLDALYGLAYMQSLRPQYRHADIRQAARRQGTGLTKTFDSYLTGRPDLHGLLGVVGTFGLLNQLLPDEYPDTVRWTDIFSDLRLYQTAAVEVLPNSN